MLLVSLSHENANFACADACLSRRVEHDDATSSSEGEDRMRSMHVDARQRVVMHGSDDEVEGGVGWRSGNALVEWGG